jgi:hypothetical protein
MGVTAASPLVLFFWDFWAFIRSASEQDCVAAFSGQGLISALLAFLFKVVALQGPVVLIYYCIYLRRKDSIVSVI